MENKSFSEKFKNTYLNAFNCHLHKINENKIIIIIEIIEDGVNVIKFHLVEYDKERQGDPFIVSEIDNICENLKLDKETSISCSAISNKNLIINVGKHLHVINIEEKRVVWSHETQYQLDRVDSIENTNDFFGLMMSSQLVYIKFMNDKNEFNLISNNTWKASKIEIMNNFAAFYNQETHNLVVYNIDQIKSSEFLPKNPLFQLNIPNLEFISFSVDSKYMALVENEKHLSLYRLNDFSKCASVLLYSRINSIIISEKYVSMAMSDRRILSYLIVDPHQPEHLKRIKELPNR